MKAETSQPWDIVKKSLHNLEEVASSCSSHATIPFRRLYSPGLFEDIGTEAQPALGLWRLSDFNPRLLVARNLGLEDEIPLGFSDRGGVPHCDAWASLQSRKALPPVGGGGLLAWKPISLI